MNIVFFLHDIADAGKFEQLLLWLKSRYRMIGSHEVKEFYYGGIHMRNCCHITIDDGWKSTYDNVFPVLKKYNVPASIFVSAAKCEQQENFWYQEITAYDSFRLKRIITDRRLFDLNIEKIPLDHIFKALKIDIIHSVLEEYRQTYSPPPLPRNNMNISELLEMDKSGLVEIGAHTLTHPILALESDQRSEAEIRGSISRLEEILGHNVTTFAYPNGISGIDFTTREIAVLRQCRIELAYSVNNGQMNKHGDPLTIPRVCSRSRLKLGPIGLKLPSLHDQLKTREKLLHNRIKN